MLLLCCLHWSTVIVATKTTATTKKKCKCSNIRILFILMLNTMIWPNFQIVQSKQHTHTATKCTRTHTLVYVSMNRKWISTPAFFPSLKLILNRATNNKHSYFEFYPFTTNYIIRQINNTTIKRAKIEITLNAIYLSVWLAGPSVCVLHARCLCICALVYSTSIVAVQ